MKKIFLPFIALSLFSALCFSCKEKSAGNGESVDSAPAQKERKVSQSRIIYSGWDLYEEQSDGKMYAVREAECGDSVSIYMKEDGSIEQKNAVRHLQSGKEENYRDHIEDMINHVEMPVRAVLGSSSISLQDFVNLQVGDIIRLNTGVAEELDVYVGNIKKFTALPGAVKKDYAVRITSVIREEE